MSASAPWSIERIEQAGALALMPVRPAQTVVAVVDTGVDVTNPALRPRMWKSPAGLATPDGLGVVPAGSPGWDFLDSDADPSPVPQVGATAPGAFFNHGTKVAGVIAAVRDPDHDIEGVNPYARVMAVRACDSGEVGCPSQTIVSAMAWAADRGARVVNISVGGEFPSEDEEAVIRDRPGTLFVVSAGNGGRDLDASADAGHWPCSYPQPNLLCVASSDANDEIAASSNTGEASVDLAAPGVRIRTTVAGGAGLGSGTSEAAPAVAGVASLLYSAFPTASAIQVRNAILAGVRTVPSMDGRLAVPGVVNARRALERLYAIRGVRPPQRVTIAGRSPASLAGTGSAACTARARVVALPARKPSRPKPVSCVPRASAAPRK